MFRIKDYVIEREGAEMSWYNEERDGETKRYIEWAFGVEVEPDEEAGYYRPKKKVEK